MRRNDNRMNTKRKVHGKKATRKFRFNDPGVESGPHTEAQFPSRTEIAATLTTWGESADENDKLIDAIELIMRGPLNTPEVGEKFLGVWGSKAANGARLLDDYFASVFFGWPPGKAKRLAALYEAERWAEIEAESENSGLPLSKTKTIANENQDALSRDALENRLREVSDIEGEQKDKLLNLLEVIVRTPLKPQTVEAEFHTLWHLRGEIDEMELDKIIEHLLGLRPKKARSLALAFEDRWMDQQSNVLGGAGGGKFKSTNSGQTGTADATTPEDNDQKSDEETRSDDAVVALAETGSSVEDTTSDFGTAPLEVLDPGSTLQEAHVQQPINPFTEPFKDEPLPDSERTPLNAQEAATLQKCKDAIKNGFKAFVEAGRACSIIMRQRLYRATHKRFAEFCEEVLGMTYRRAYQLRDAADFVERLNRLNNCSKKRDDASELPLPENESQVRVLTGLPPQEQLEAWKEVHEKAPDGIVTGKTIQSIVRARKKRITGNAHGQEEEEKPTGFDPATELKKTINWLSRNREKWPIESRHLLTMGISDWLQFGSEASN